MKILMRICYQFYKNFMHICPQTGEDQFDSQLFAENQLTVERATNVVASVSNGYSAKDRLEGINLQLGDWHAAVKILDVSCLCVY